MKQEHLTKVALLVGLAVIERLAEATWSDSKSIIENENISSFEDISVHSGESDYGNISPEGWYREKQRELVMQLKEEGFIVSYRTRNAMEQCYRMWYVNSTENVEMPIGHGAVMDAPYWHAFVLEVLKDYIYPFHNVMEIGCGSGYLSAAFAMLMGSHEGLVLAMEINEDLEDFARINLYNDHPDLIPTKKVVLLHRDGLLGAPNATMVFDAIYIGFNVKQIPRVVINQLKVGGCLMVPIDKSKDKMIAQLVKKDKLGELIFERIDLNYLEKEVQERGMDPF